MKKRRWWDHLLYFGRPPIEPEPIPKLRVVTIQKGDVLVLSVNQRLSPDRIKHLKELMHQTFVGDNKVIVLDDGAEFSVVRSLKSEW